MWFIMGLIFMACLCVVGVNVFVGDTKGNPKFIAALIFVVLYVGKKLIDGAVGSAAKGKESFNGDNN